jgi:hypothetical protein
MIYGQNPEQKLDLSTPFINLSAQALDLSATALDLSASKLDLSTPYKKIDKSP